ncbi:flagellar assembly protein FliX [Aestuariispira ectoiniformans]|uniref:flagellar assembly protein FliX n=1 Tax=Aestuariispira ectoiniformans TaxID=2775080 RepID=UPI00223B0FF0|nr:flagellar assembly protein FliX [Aestuariispira ectoiniformans]
MKVQGPGSTRRTSSTKKTSKSRGTGGADFARALNDVSGEDAHTEAAASAGPVSAVDALLSLQQVDDATQGGGRAQAVAWGEDMLDRLEAIRNALLMGAVPYDRLVQLAESVSKQAKVAGDPKLSAVLGEIELRAQVEIAKLEKARK